MKRNPRKLKWTKAFRKSAGKEMVRKWTPSMNNSFFARLIRYTIQVVDSTLTFAARRNVPVRYNRDLVATTLKAMQRVSEIRQRRERVFYKKRMEGNKERERAANRKLVQENAHLLPRVRGSEKKALQEAAEEVEVDVEETVNKKEVFGKMKVRRKALVGGGVEDEMMDMD